jgi:hypothetical protein
MGGEVVTTQALPRLGTSVRFTSGDHVTLWWRHEGEIAAIKLAAKENGVTQSELIRQIVGHVGHVEDMRIQAFWAGLPLGAWIRVIVLAAIGYTELFGQIQRARDGLVKP